MPTRTISITEEAYQRLAAKKSTHESFSDIIVKITGGNEFMKGFGIFSADKGKSLLEEIKNDRKGWKREVHLNAP